MGQVNISPAMAVKTGGDVRRAGAACVTGEPSITPDTWPRPE